MVDGSSGSGSPGIVTTSGTTYGIRASTNGLLFINQASNYQITQKASSYLPLTPQGVDHAVKVGITTNTNTLTTAEKQAACTWLGVSEWMEGTIGTDVNGIYCVIPANAKRVRFVGSVENVDETLYISECIYNYTPSYDGFVTVWQDKNRFGEMYVNGNDTGYYIWFSDALPTDVAISVYYSLV